ncbi:MAG: sulfite exporter TauE/SafE family protein [Pseudomonadota bacterium]|nr:sulfite exporter TauE/SafE family protein [Pseudomonadota bacterium]MEC8029759.1 sulfite exporter TauE/SafE family protein [Pseudomonadota bacterium]MEC8322366.1 sulfite exporter TauE/SafE family protein [Pseudomonadota bacterium]MEC8519204.1 sulfite exporter TauE/SafE family protein [Pseudomonadota bacterium]MEC8534776.1 sulfite exporter TauE/SafE family protein [Pseudomonadota bacterium]
MQIYLPIAETSVNIFLLLGLGGLVGFLSGMFGVGGGFLMTPLLIFVGIPPTVAVASEANQILASSISGGMAHFQKRGVDMRMGCVLLAGGLLGSAVGVQLYAVMREIGQIDLMISLCYVVFLGVIGLLMMIESIRAIHARQIGRHIPARRPGQHNWIHGLPFKMRFKVSQLYTSIIPPILIGFFVGILAAIMGVGGGFIMVPAMIYLLRMPTNVVIGTSLFQIIFVSAAVTIMHAVKNQTVDVVLATILIIGGVMGAQIGARIGQKLRGEQLRALLALIVLGVGLKMLSDLLFMPAEIYSLSSLGMMP